VTPTRKILIFTGEWAAILAFCLLLLALFSKSVPAVFWALGLVGVTIVTSLVEEFLRGDEEEEAAR
jgi:hypothetical protein